MRAMIIQPMGGKTDEEIVMTKNRAKKVLEEKGYEVVDTFFNDDFHNEEKLKERGIAMVPLYFLGESLQRMSECRAVYACKGWETARGCKIEHETALSYGLDIIYEE